MTAFSAVSCGSSLGVFGRIQQHHQPISATVNLSIIRHRAFRILQEAQPRNLAASIDLMKGVYRAVQANFTTLEGSCFIGAAAMPAHDFGREIDTTRAQTLSPSFATLSVSSLDVKVYNPTCSCAVVT